MSPNDLLFADNSHRSLQNSDVTAFFLDVLDAYHAFASSDDERAAQEAGMVRAIRLLKSELPAARLMVNRGFEILPAIHRDVEAVVAESLYRGWDPAANAYREVPAADRAFLLDALGRAKIEYGLATIAIDYVAPGERVLARETATKIAAHGVIPWVAEHTLAQIGIGAIEVLPRKVLVLHEDTRTAGFGAEIAATVAEEAFESLDAPVVRITAPDTPVPFSPPLEKAFIPQVDDVLAAIARLAAY